MQSNLPKLNPLFTTLLSMALPFAASAQTNVATDRLVNFSVVADAVFSAKQMPIIFNLAYTISGDGTITSSSIGQAAVTDVYMADVSTSFKAYAAASSYTPINQFGQFLADYSVYFTWFTVATLAVDAYQQYVVADHTKVRLYQFIIPVDGYYDITYWVPGDWDKPASDVYVTSYTAISANTQTLFSQDAVSDRTLTNHVFLNAGLNTVKIDVGSGTVLTHNAGNLVSINMNDTTVRTWTVSGFPTNSSQFELGSIVSASIGGTTTITIPFSPSANPLNTSGGTPTTYSNPRVLSYLPSKPPVRTLVRGPNNGQSSYTFFTEPDATISSSFSNNAGIFTTTRLSDYSFEVIVKCLQTP